MAGWNHRMGQQPMKLLDVLQGHPTEPGREIVEALPEKAAGFMDTLRDQYEDLRKNFMLDKERLMRTTSDPATVPWLGPALSVGIPTSFVKGRDEADAVANDIKKKELDVQVAKAKQEFEEALSAEMTGGKQASTAGEFLDGMAQLHIKEAFMEEGDAAKLLNYYLAAAGLLGKGGDLLGYNIMSRADPRRIEAKALESAVRERMRENPTPIYVLPQAQRGAVQAEPLNMEASPSGQEPTDVLPDKSPGEIEP